MTNKQQQQQQQLDNQANIDKNSERLHSTAVRTYKSATARCARD
jgi:hypothetical protein